MLHQKKKSIEFLELEDKNIKELVNEKTKLSSGIGFENIIHEIITKKNYIIKLNDSFKKINLKLENLEKRFRLLKEEEL